MRYFLWLTILLSACAQVMRTPAADHEMAVPDENAFRGWRSDEKKQTSSEKPASLPSLTPACADTRLRPTHPQMSSKLYHDAEVGLYDHFRLTAESPACAVKGKKANARGVVPCLGPDILYRLTISDLYADACGNIYRAFTRLQFFRREEDMGTLFSPGRSLRKNPKSEFENDFLPSATEAVAAEDFFALRAATNAEMAKAAEQRAKALEQGFREEGGLFFVR